MKKIINVLHSDKLRNFLTICSICLIFLLTQYFFSINISSKTIYLYYFEIITIVLFLIALSDIILNKKKIKVSKPFLGILTIFVLWFIFLIICRFFFSGNITGGFIIFRVLFFPIILMLLFHQYSINQQKILIALIIFVFLVNLYQIYDLIFINNSFRMMQGLQNLNIYLCFAISSIPLMLYYINYYKKNKFINIITCVNIFLIIIFSLLSGSRIGMVMCPFVFIVSYFLNFKATKKTIISLISVVLIITSTLLGIIHFNVLDSNDNITRSLEPLTRIFNIADTENKDNVLPDNLVDDTSNVDGVDSENQTTNIQDEINNNVDKDKNNTSIVEGEDDETNEEEQNATIIDSNNMRYLIWKKSISYIMQNPILGRGNTDIEIDMHFVNASEPVKTIQSPHNFILEIWLALGLPGLVIYSLIIVWSMIKVLKQQMDIKDKLNFLLILFAVLGFSFFQPLLTSYFVISIMLWISLYSYLKEVK